MLNYNRGAIIMRRKKKLNMKNIKKLILMAICLTICIVIIVLLGRKIVHRNEKVIYLENMQVENKIIDKTDLFKNLDDYTNYFHTDPPKGVNFNRHNYVLISLAHNKCTESEVAPKNYKISKNTIHVNVEYNRECNSCDTPAFITEFYLLEISKKYNSDIEVDIDYNSKKTTSCHNLPGNQTDKPIIYLYPEEDTNVTVKLRHPELITTSYPKYDNEWNILAKKDGTLIDNKTGRELYALYWEGKDRKISLEEEGFIVRGEDTISFLEEKLSILGLTARESEEFIVYWLPKMENNKYNYIRFETMEEINNYMPLEITPKPDTVIRVLMDYKKLDKKIKVKEQKLETPTRQGFTVVEWGGSEFR